MNYRNQAGSFLKTPRKISVCHVSLGPSCCLAKKKKEKKRKKKRRRRGPSYPPEIQKMQKETIRTAPHPPKN
jgi:hypothetical protein